MSNPVRVLVAALLGVASLATTAAPVSGQGTWESTLHARDINGNAVALNAASAVFFYDTVLDVTWLGNFNAGAGSAFDDGVSTTDGLMTWRNAMAWAAALNVGGYTGWRLPTIIDSGAPGCNFAYAGTDCGYNVQTQVGSAFSEWAHLFHVTLGNLSIVDTAGFGRGGISGVNYGLVNTANFQNLMSGVYWSGMQDASDATQTWGFATFTGFQATFSNGGQAQTYAAAVRTGDVLAAVPEPQALGLALTALAALAVARRRRAG